MLNNETLSINFNELNLINPELDISDSYTGLYFSYEDTFYGTIKNDDTTLNFEENYIIDNIVYYPTTDTLY